MRFRLFLFVLILMISACSFLRSPGMTFHKKQFPVKHTIVIGGLRGEDVPLVALAARFHMAKQMWPEEVEQLRAFAMQANRAIDREDWQRVTALLLVNGELFMKFRSGGTEYRVKISPPADAPGKYTAVHVGSDHLDLPQATFEMDL